jgi:hypothetical protein
VDQRQSWLEGPETPFISHEPQKQPGSVAAQQVLHPGPFTSGKNALEPQGLLACSACLGFHGCQRILGLINKCQPAFLFFGLLLKLSMFRQGFKKKPFFLWTKLLRDELYMCIYVYIYIHTGFWRRQEMGFEIRAWNFLCKHSMPRVVPKFFLIFVIYSFLVYYFYVIRILSFYRGDSL